MGSFVWTTTMMMISATVIGASDRPSYIGCVDPGECSETQCCVIGNTRYSFPMCANVGGVGDICRPGNIPFDTTVNYPHGISVDLVDVYLTFCECAEGLICDRETATCQKE